MSQYGNTRRDDLNTGTRQAAYSPGVGARGRGLARGELRHRCCGC